MRWIVHEERTVDDSHKTHLHIARVELPDGTEFSQYVLRCPRAAMVLAVDEEGRVLLMRRHRFIIDRWCWELPGGYVDEGEDAESAAARELTEETGWVAARLEELVTYQPMVGLADHENVVYLARDVRQVTDVRDPNEAETLRWMPLAEALQLVKDKEIVGVATVMGLLAVENRRLEG